MPKGKLTEPIAKEYTWGEMNPVQRDSPTMNPARRDSFSVTIVSAHKISVLVQRGELGLRRWLNHQNWPEIDSWNPKSRIESTSNSGPKWQHFQMSSMVSRLYVWIGTSSLHTFHWVRLKFFIRLSKWVSSGQNHAKKWQKLLKIDCNWIYANRRII